MADLTGPQLTEFRRDYVQDLVDEGANPKVYLSVYNRSTRSQFVADATIQALNAEIQQDQAEELARVYNAKQIERQAAGDDLATAQAAGAAVQLQAIYRLLRARVRRLMLRDTVMVQSLGVNGPAVMKSWRDEIVEDENFAQRRQGAFASVPLYRR